MTGSGGNRGVWLAFVGDIMAGDSHHALGRGARAALRRNKYQLYDKEVLRERYGADLLIGNLECSVVARERNATWMAYSGDSDAVIGLRDAGFDAVGVVNNHVDDYCTEGEKSSEEIVVATGLRTIGREVTTVECNGMTIGLVAHSFVPTWSRPSPVSVDTLVERVSGWKQQCEALIVLLHWGAEYMTMPSRSQVRAARRLVDAGVVAVVGSHPHVVQEPFVVNGSVVAPSLGNFVSDTLFWPQSTIGGVLRVLLVDRGNSIRAGQAEWCRIDANVYRERVGRPLELWRSLRDLRDVHDSTWRSGLGAVDYYQDYQRRLRNVRIARWKSLTRAAWIAPWLVVRYWKYKAWQRNRGRGMSLNDVYAWHLDATSS